MVELGTAAPDFSLPDATSSQLISLESFTGKEFLMVMFICRHCPFVKHVANEIARIANDYGSTSLGIVAISSSDVKQFPEDSPQGLKQMADHLGLRFPVCYDETQETAKRYNATCTPDFFIFNRDRRLIYRGRLDDSRPGGKPANGTELRAALDAALSGGKVSASQKPSVGCNIKWKPGNEPDYAINFDRRSLNHATNG